MSDPIRHKLNEWEATPPPGAWEVISQHLKERNAEKQLSRRLDAMETTPPPSSWSFIQAEIQQTTPFEKGTVPIRTLLPYLLRYGAAAACIGFIFWLFSSGILQSPTDVSSSTLPLQPATNAAAADNTIASSPAAPIPPAQEIQLNASPLDLVKGKQAAGSRASREPDHAPVRPVSKDAAGLNAMNWPPEMAYHSSRFKNRKLPVQQGDQRYIVIQSANGTAIRLSAKYAPVYMDLMYREDGISANNTSAVWRLEQQLLQSHYVPDPGNLFDLLQLKEFLQEN